MLTVFGLCSLLSPRWHMVQQIFAALAPSAWEYDARRLGSQQSIHDVRWKYLHRRHRCPSLFPGPPSIVRKQERL